MLSQIVERWGSLSDELKRAVLAVGQSLNYSFQSNRKAGIVLIVEKQSDYKYLIRPLDFLVVADHAENLGVADFIRHSDATPL
jgi:hypothetical protein